MWVSSYFVVLVGWLLVVGTGTFGVWLFALRGNFRFGVLWVFSCRLVFSLWFNVGWW